MGIEADVDVYKRQDVDRVVQAARQLPPAEGNYLVDDFVTNLLATVIDFQMHTTAVENALLHFRNNLHEQIRTLDDLQALMAQYPNDKEGNTALAQGLWGYKLWTRAEMLRGLVAFFDRTGIRDQEALHRWAQGAKFKPDFEGQVRGLGPTVFLSLIHI